MSTKYNNKAQKELITVNDNNDNLQLFMFTSISDE